MMLFITGLPASMHHAKQPMKRERDLGRKHPLVTCPFRLDHVCRTAPAYSATCMQATGLGSPVWLPQLACRPSKA